jgi:protein CpxP
MKKLIIVTILAFSLTNYAQDKKEMPHRDKTEKKSPEERNEIKLKKMTSELNLDAKQQKEMADFMTERSKKREGLRSEKRAAHKKQIDKDKEVMNTKMKGMLSPEQYKKWEASKEKHHQRRAHHKGHKEGSPKEEMKK